tara:strand:- start:198 stop:329 length:132 start_codon:yes stop_codon:yes gene_type:complete
MGIIPLVGIVPIIGMLHNKGAEFSALFYFLSNGYLEHLHGNSD